MSKHSPMEHCLDREKKECDRYDDALQNAFLADATADFASFLPVFHDLETAPPDCIKYALIRRALSVGNYAEAFVSSEPTSPDAECGRIVSIERTRYHWFAEEFTIARRRALALLQEST